jgi:NAD-dependent dihydropyrimidine dehydrogenase PreA subunit
VRRLLTLRGWPLLPQIAIAVALVTVVAALALGDANPEHNLGMYLLWGLWWAVLPLSFVVLGRLWCAICPVTLLGDRAARSFPGRPAFPAFVGRNAAIFLVASFAAVHVANLWFTFEGDRRATGALLAVLGSAAFALTLACRDRRWCSALCPVGALGSYLARLSPLRIANGAAPCPRECAERGCAGGGAGRTLCPVGLDLRAGIDPGDCILCGACLKACPRLGEVGWAPHGPDRVAASPAVAQSLAVLAFLGLSIDMALAHLLDWPILFWQLSTSLGVAAGAWAETALHLGVIAAPPLLALALRLLGPAGQGAAARLAALAAAALPLAGAGLLAVTLRPLLVEGPLQLQQLLRGAGWEGSLALGAVRRLDGFPMRLMQEAVVAAGILVALRVALRRPGQGGPAAADGAGGRLAGAALVLLAGAALLWICSRQMTS